MIAALRKPRSMIIIACVLALAAVYASILLQPISIDHFKYKLTIHAIVDGNSTSASGVIGVTRIWTRRYDLSLDSKTLIDGEAVFLDAGRDKSGKPRNVMATLISRDPQGRGMANRWPFWGEKTLQKQSKGLGPTHYKWVEYEGFDYPPQINKFDATPISSKILLEKTKKPVLFSAPDPETGYQIGDTERSFLAFHGLNITAITAEPTENEPITRELAHHLPWINSEAAKKWHVTIGDRRDISIFIRNDSEHPR